MLTVPWNHSVLTSEKKFSRLCHRLLWATDQYSLPHDRADFYPFCIIDLSEGYRRTLPSHINEDGGFAIVGLGSIAPALQFLYVVMMVGHSLPHSSSSADASIYTIVDISTSLVSQALLIS